MWLCPNKRVTVEGHVEFGGRCGIEISAQIAVGGRLVSKGKIAAKRRTEHQKVAGCRRGGKGTCNKARYKKWEGAPSV